MAYASQTPTALLLAPCQCRVTHPWTLNPTAAAKYYRPIQLAAGFQSARRRRRTRRVISDAYHIISYQISDGDFNRISYRYERRPSNIVEFRSFFLQNGKKRTF